MAGMHKQLRSGFKAEVAIKALEALKKQKTIAELASELSIHPSQI